MYLYASGAKCKLQCNSVCVCARTVNLLVHCGVANGNSPVLKEDSTTKMASSLYYLCQQNRYIAF